MFYLYSSYAEEILTSKRTISSYPILDLNNDNTRRDFDFKENHLLKV